MQVIVRPNHDLVKPTRFELVAWRALTRTEDTPLTVAAWNEGIDRGLKLWGEAHAHTPALAELCEALLRGLQISDGDYEAQNFIVRYENE